jgi:hypothetical protein
VPLWAREASVARARVFRLRVCVCVHFPALQRKKGTREGTFSLSLSFSSSFQSSAALCAFFFFDLF